MHRIYKENVRALSCIILFVTLSATSIYASTDGFGLRAYYTKVSTGEPFEKYSRTDKYADIKVNLDGDRGDLVFYRGSSYLPYWQTSKGKWFLNEEIKRSGDGPQGRPDKSNTYSQVKVVETSPARASVNWRYVPDMSLIEEKGWAEESFTVYPDGVLIRAIRKEYKELEDWEDPSNLIIKKLMLTENGVEPLASAWSSTPELSLSGASASDYFQKDFDQTKRAYVLRLKKNGLPSNLSVTVSAGVRNPVLFIENWGDAAVESVRMNSEEFKDYRVGYEYRFDGVDLVIWFDKESDAPLNVQIVPGESVAPGNGAPKVSAGNDQSLLVASSKSGPFTFELAGSCSDDGLPNAEASVKWERVSGGSVEFSHASILDPSVKVSSDGLYVLRLTVSDGELETSDEVNIVVDKNPGVFDTPIASWDFNEKSGNKTMDAVSKTADKILGHSRRVQGVVGNCVEFSEFDTDIMRTGDDAPDVDTSAFTVEAWVAPKAYPWNWIPIAMQRSESAGYFFGLDGDNRVGLHVFVDGEWRECNTEMPFEGMTTWTDAGDIPVFKKGGVEPKISLPLLKWSHVVGTFSKEDGARVYINGELKASESFKGEMKPADDADFHIGRSTVPRYPAHTERRRGTDQGIYSFDGLMDEIKIYNKSLTPEDVKKAYGHAQPKIAQPLELRDAPKGPDGPLRFAAYQTTLKFDDSNYDRIWRVGDNADVVVMFDEFNYKMVWWHGVAYYPIYYAANGIGLTHEVAEAHVEETGCAEALMDKECRYGRVQVLENTDARVVIKFRSAGADRRYDIAHLDQDHDGWGCWADETLTIYPDGTMPRKMTLWCSVQDRWHEFEQENYFMSPGQTPMGILDMEVNTIVNLDGDVSELSWETGWPEGEFVDDAVIKTYNYKADSRAYAITLDGLHVIYSTEIDDTPLEGPRRPPPNNLPWWDHWPVSQIRCDGKQPLFINGHFSSTCSGAVFTVNQVDVPANLDHELVEKTSDRVTVPYLFGMTAGEPKDLVPLARMYNKPPKLQNTLGCSFMGFDIFRLEYRLKKDADRMTFTINGMERSPIVNPCFTVANWGSMTAQARLKIDGKEVEDGRDFRQGIIVDTDGTPTLVLWAKFVSEKATDFHISVR